MARRVSRRKKPRKEEYQLKERMKVENEVFDKNTLLVLEKLIKKGIISAVDYPISTGKEANVFRATSASGTFLVVKIYKITTTPFFRREEYLDGDPRFEKTKRSPRAIIFAFAHKEFKNLAVCEKAGVHSPKPIYCDKNVVVMEFLGKEGLPYATMNMVAPRGENDLASILDDIKKMYKNGIVHADISEYNVVLGEVPYIIDFGQGVVTRHPNAERFLERDVKNILRYFEKHGIVRDLKEVLEWIKR
jgi:RIO kinase 1